MKKLYAFFLLLPLLCAGAAAQPKWGENLVENPGFSDEWTGWLVNGERTWLSGGGKSPDDHWLAFSGGGGELSQSISLSDRGFSAADLDEASVCVSVDAYYRPFAENAAAGIFSAVFVLSGGLMTCEVELIPDSARFGLSPWTTFSDTVKLSDLGFCSSVVVKLSGKAVELATSDYVPWFDNVSVSVIRGGATALPPSPAVASDASAPLFDLQGRRVASPVRGRPYVQGGRLKVAR